MLFSLTIIPMTYKHESVSLLAIDLLLAPHSVFDNIGLGEQNQGVRTRFSFIIYC